MKNRLRFSAATDLFLLTTALLRADYPATVLRDEPVGYWRLGEADLRDPVIDESDNELDGEYFDNGNLGLELGFPGAIVDDDDTAVRFQTTPGFGCGDCGQAQVPVGGVLDLGTLVDGASLTLEAWFKLLPSVNEALPGSFFSRIFHYNNGAKGQYAFGVVGNNNAGFPGQRTVWAAIGDGGGSGGVIKAAAADAIEPSDEEVWHHFAAVIDAGKIRLFLNGEELENLDDSDPVAWQATQATIGARIQNNGNLVQAFPGLIDELAVYPDALDEEVIFQHFEAGTDPDVDPPRVQFRRGDSDGSGGLEITDAIALLNFLFLGEESPTCRDASDSDDNGELQLTDAVLVLQFLFLGGRPPAAPHQVCGVDETEDTLDCESFAACRPEA